MNPIFEKIAQYIKANCQADDYTLQIQTDESHETRFAQNRVTQHIAGPEMEIGLDVAYGDKTGSSSVNQFDEETLDYLIKTAQDIARLNRPDPEYMPSAGPQELPKVQNADPATRDLDPAKMVEFVQGAIDRAKGFDAMVSGMTEKHHGEFFMATKNGFSGYDENTRFGHSMTLKKKDVETKVSYSARDHSGFSLEEEFAKLRSQVESLETMKDFDPCKIAVILRPAALEELLWFMGWMMNRRQSDEGFTPFTGQIGKPCFGEKFTWRSTLQCPQINARPFNYEGVPSKETSWVEDGILKNMPTDRFWAKKINAEPMSPFNIFIPGGDASEEDMMKLVPRGLIINRFWYIRSVDAKAGELTGMTRDGVLYFEDGEVKHAVNNLRFNEIPHLATKRILALGPGQVVSPYSNIPTLLIDGFNFVDKTSF